MLYQKIQNIMLPNESAYRKEILIQLLSNHSHVISTSRNLSTKIKFLILEFLFSQNVTGVSYIK